MLTLTNGSKTIPAPVINGKLYQKSGILELKEALKA
jgi:hypothetical protein